MEFSNFPAESYDAKMSSNDQSVDPKKIILLLSWSILTGFLPACTDKIELFTLMPSSQTHVTFSNDLEENDDFNIMEYLYYYDGGGVSVGDVNNDGLKDLFFTANLLPNRLYLNKGGLEFEDHFETSGIGRITGWSIGKGMADVNGDGYLDIYVSQLGDYKSMKGVNQLYINNGANGDEKGLVTFTEKAAEYGIDHVGFSTQASFFDYDNDGDLDMYLLNHAVHSDRSYGPSTLRYQHDFKYGDKLFRNDFDGDEPRFTEVTREAGIFNSPIGYGLAITAGDINFDGWTDIYISNDFHENDYLYINNGDGTFSETLEKSIGHSSRSSMGNDLADFNNDGLLDIMVLDMLPDREAILKKSAGEDLPNIYNIKIEFGYSPQLTRNTLQLNLGNGIFSEIALLSGVYATDWSWAPLFCDLDNDGNKDLVISNGIFKRPNDLDYLSLHISMRQMMNNTADQNSIDRFLSDEMPSERIPNKIYRNNGDLTFTDVAKDWGLTQAGFSNGAAYADLDNDGDLDLVFNNVNEEAYIYRNNSNLVSKNNYLQVRLRGSDRNTKGTGAKVILKFQGKLLYQEVMPVRGFQSSVDNVLNFGIGQQSSIDTLQVIWPNGKTQILLNVPGRQMVTLDQQNARLDYHYPSHLNGPALFQVDPETLHIDFKHRENRYNDFNYEPLVPHKLSTQGPPLAVADVNGDGLDDFFVGGAKNQPSQLYLQNSDGGFDTLEKSGINDDSIREDIDACFFNANGDSYPDLYVVSGGNEWSASSINLADCLYLNDGKGHFIKSTQGLPPGLAANGSCVAPADFDNDGDMDLFVGSRSVPGKYGLSATSYLLENDGQGRFRDVTTELAPQLVHTGMVTDAVWTDMNNDGKMDLVICGEWMPIKVFKNSGGRLKEVTASCGLRMSNGWWNTLEAADMDGDGDEDLIAGNLGLNSKIKATVSEPATIYVKDFDTNGKIDQILCFYKNGESVPFATRDELIRQLPGLRSKFNTYEDYSRVETIHDIFSENQMKDALIKKAYHFQSSYIENRGNGKFILHPLPVEAQFTPIYGLLVDDFDKDGKPDLVIGGNFKGATINFGIYDAGYGLYLRGDGLGGFKVLGPKESGLVIRGEIRDFDTIKLAGGDHIILVGMNNDSLGIVRVN